MFRFPSAEDIEELQAFSEPFCVTIYAPYIEELAGVNPNKLQLKNMIREAERRLITDGVESRVVRRTTTRARSLLEKKQFWHLRGAGLAIFAHPKFFRCYLLPSQDLPYHLTVEEGFELEPLLSVLENDQAYFILTVSHNHVRLYQGGHYTVKEVFLKNLPTSLKDDLRLDEYEHWAETHTVAPASRAAHSEAFHSQSNEKEVDKDELFQFFRHIDSRLHKYLRGKKVPLIFAGVDYLMPIYKKANTYPYLAAKGIPGNPDRKDLNLIRQQAWTLLSH